METYSKVIGSKIKESAEAFAFSQTEQFIKGNGSMIYQKDQASLKLPEEISLRVNSSKVNLNPALPKFSI